MSVDVAHKILPTLLYYRENRSAGLLERVGMKQRIRVVGIIKNKDGVLVFKRNHGRSETSIFWELPTGKINFGEQPEEAMARSLTEYTGLSASNIRLKDVITFLAPEGSSRMSNLYIVYELTVSEDARPTPRDRYSAYKFIKDVNNLNIHLNEATGTVLEMEDASSTASNFRSTANTIIINVDGASRGNPGPAGIGYCIHDESGRIIERDGEFIGFATSRVAEYYAMRKGIERAIELNLKSVHFISDSLMVINQLNGIFSIKNQDILPIYRDIKSKLENFTAVSFSHVPRSQNAVADKEANIAIDKILKK